MEKMTKLTAAQRFFRLLELEKKDIFYIYVYAIFAGIITLSLPLGIQAIIGLLAAGTISVSLVVLIVIVTLGTAFSGGLTIMQLTITETIRRRIFARYSFDFSLRIPRLLQDQLVRKYPPELINRFFDILTLQKGIAKILMDFSTAVLQIAFGLLLLAFYHPFFVFFGLILVTILIMIFYFTGPNGLKTSLKESTYKYEVAYWLEELARALQTFKLAGATRLPVNRTDELVSNYLVARQKHFRVLLLQYGNIVAFKTILTAGLLGLGSYLVVNNQINIGQFVAAEIVVLLIMGLVEKLIVDMDTIYDVLTALEKLGSVTDLELEPGEGIPYAQIQRGPVHLKTSNLYFKFEDAKTPTLDRLNLEVKPGEMVCVSGYSGSGKTTLIKLLTGYYREYEGSIRFNNVPLKNIELSSIRNHIGYYGTGEDIFRGSIVENIGMGRTDIGVDRIVEVTEKLGLTNWLDSRAEGLDFQLLPGGMNIPKGIRTKILVARSAVMRPCLLTLEADFHSLETTEMRQILDYITSSDCSWTLMVVSNDPLVAAYCDRVIIMKEGKIVEDGTYRQILNSQHYEHIFMARNGLADQLTDQLRGGRKS